MDYCQFVQAVEQKVKEGIGARASVKIHTARKYNGTIRRGLLFSEQESNISPTIYLEEYYRRFEMGDTVAFIAQEILSLYDGIRFEEPWHEDIICDYGNMEERIVYRLIKREMNRELLEDMPYVPYMDLAIVFYVLFEADVYGTAAMPVKKEHLKFWGISETEIYERAGKNTPRLLGCEFRTMHSIVAEPESREDEKDEDILYVLSNRIRSYGASAILYPGRLERIGEYLGEDFYVLPSSVHEVIVLRKSAAAGRFLLDMIIREVNETQLEKEEILSDRAYYYDCSQKKLIM